MKGEDQTQKMYVIRLKNSNVEEMEKIMSKLVSQMNNMTPAKPTKKGVKPTKAMVVSDIERNALVVLATAEQMKNIRDTVRRIDIPKVQVYVKAKIVEVDTNLAEQIGLKYGMEGGTITSNGLFTMAANMGAASLNVSPALQSFLTSETYHPGTGGSDGTVTTDQTFKFDAGTDKIFALGAKLDLLQRNGAAHLLSEPSILCTNNKEAEIYVGQTMSCLLYTSPSPRDS